MDAPLVSDENDNEDELASFFDESVENPVFVLESEKELQETLYRLAQLRERKDVLSKELKEINKQLDIVEARAEVTFDARGIGKLGLEGVGLFYTSTKFYAAQHDKNALVEFFDSIGEGALAPRTVHPSRLTSWWRETQERGGALPPPEVASAFEKREIRFKREKAK